MFFQMNLLVSTLPETFSCSWFGLNMSMIKVASTILNSSTGVVDSRPALIALILNR